MPLAATMVPIASGQRIARGVARPVRYVQYRASLSTVSTAKGTENMSNQHLVTYLQDHLAGSVVALELLPPGAGACRDRCRRGAGTPARRDYRRPDGA